MQAAIKSRFLLLVLLSLILLPWRSAAAEEKPEAATLPGVYDLRLELTKWGLTIKPQGARNTCGVFALTGALEFALSKKLDRGVRLSEEYLNWTANAANGDGGDGATIPQLVEGFNRWGICHEALMPYTSSYNAFGGPGAAALNDAKNIWDMGFRRHWIMRGQRITPAHIVEVRKVISSGYPVCAEAEHCLLFVGYQDDPRQPGGGTFLTRNSATVRYETMSYAEAARKFYSLLWIDIPETREKKEKDKAP